jgi:protein-disulfide isomerase
MSGDGYTSASAKRTTRSAENPPQKPSLFDRALSITLTVSAIVVVALLVRREFRVEPGDKSDRTPIRVASWDSLLAIGHLRDSSSDAGVSVAVLSDLECPGCANFEHVIDAVLEKRPKNARVFFVHYPLRTHRFAVPSAAVAECAGESSRFLSAARVMYAKQDSLGLKPWSDFAPEFGVSDVKAFDACIQSRRHVAFVERSRLLSEATGARFTPTVVVDGWRLPYVPTADELVAMIDRVAAGRSIADQE